jgi:HSP20 family protein
MLTRWNRPARPAFRSPDLFRLFPDVAVFPLVNITQDEKRFYLRAPLPGVKAEAFDISAVKNRITISGKRAGEDFSRSFTLPQPFDADRVEAKYEDGVLTVVLPKSAEAKPRQIAVKGGA